MSTCPPPSPDVHPSDPEPVGPLAAKYLDQLAARQADTDPDLPARQAEVFSRLRRTLAPKETKP